MGCKAVASADPVLWFCSKALDMMIADYALFVCCRRLRPAQWTMVRKKSWQHHAGAHRKPSQHAAVPAPTTAAGRSSEALACRLVRASQRVRTAALEQVQHQVRQQEQPLLLLLVVGCAAGPKPPAALATYKMMMQRMQQVVLLLVVAARLMRMARQAGPKQQQLKQRRRHL
jgi:hypothetical protein